MTEEPLEKEMPGVKRWYMDTSQVKDMDACRREISRFLALSYAKEPHIIHEVVFKDGVKDD